MKKIIKKLLRESGDYSNKEQVKYKIAENLIGEIISILNHSDQMGLDDKLSHDDLNDILSYIYENTEFLFMNDDTYLSEQRLRESYYDSDKLYSKSYIQQRLSKAPKYIKTYLSQLEEIECFNSNGQSNICVKIPEVLYSYLFRPNF